MRGSHCVRLLHGTLSSKTCWNLLGAVLPCHALEQHTQNYTSSSSSSSGAGGGSSSSCSSHPTPGASGAASSSSSNLHIAAPDTSHSTRCFSTTSSSYGRPNSDSSHLAPIPHIQGAIAQATDSMNSQQLLKAIREATEVQQLQVLLLRHTDIWRAQHIAAAFRCFPELRPHLYNARQTQLSTLGLLLRGLVRVLDHLSAPHLVEALLCLGRFRLAPPAELEAICLRLVELLEAGEQPLSARLRPQQWANAARALAALQGAQLEPHSQQGDWRFSQVVAQSRGSWAAGVGAAVADDDGNQGSESSSSSSSSGAELTRLRPSSIHSTSSTTSSSSTAGTGTSSDLVSSSSRNEASSALTQRGAMERLWLLVYKGSVTHLDNFDANDAAAWCWSLVKRRRWPQEAVRATLRSVRLRPHKLLPAHLLQVLASSLEAGVGNDEQWEVLLRALQKQRHELGLQVITRALELMAARQHYLPDVAFDLTAAALRHLKGAPTQQLLQLAAALAELGHYQAPVVKSLCKQVTPVVASLPAEDLGQLLWALQHLGHAGNEMNALVAAAVDTLADRPSLAHAGPAAAMKLLWACGSLGLGTQKVHLQLVQALAACEPQEVPHGTLCLLHQARLLLEVPKGAAGGQRPKQLFKPQQQAAGGAQRGSRPTRGGRPGAGSQHGDEWVEDFVVHDVGSGNQQQQQQQSQEQVSDQEGLPWPEPLMAAAAAAAGVYATQVAASERPRRQQIAALLQQCGLPPLLTHNTPVPGVVADVGLLGEGGGVAVLASGARYTRSRPVQLMGYWRNAEQLLRQQGWRVVHLPPHEWEALVGEGAEEDDALVHVANKLLEAGVTW